MEERSAQSIPNGDGSLLHGDITGEVIGAFYEVCRVLKFGYLESAYCGALAVELTARGIPFKREYPLDVVYKGTVVSQYRADFLVAGKVIVEVKSQAEIGAPDKRQLLNYLCATRLRVGLLLNFGPEAKFLRAINS
jgi:GxxExxY protein